MSKPKNPILTSEEQQKEIANIFNRIYAKRPPKDLKELLSEYESSLKEEAKFLSARGQYDHPVRAAQALAELLGSEINDDSINKFLKVANDSQFSPRTRAFASGLAANLVFCAICTSIVFLVLNGTSMSIEALQFGVAYAAATSFTLGMPMGVMSGRSALKTYQPITTIKEKSGLLAEALRLFRAPPAGTEEKGLVNEAKATYS